MPSNARGGNHVDVEESAGAEDRSVDSGPGHGHTQGDVSGDNVQDFWEGLYRERGQRWSGLPNPRLVEVAGDLPPGSALDLGCGEGGDAIWLARHGWAVTAVDVSPTALGRLSGRAEAEGIADRLDAIHIDLATAFPSAPEGGWDLVSAQFLQSPVDLPRTRILRRAAADIATGGLLLVVDHGAGPPQSSHHDVVFPTVDETVSELALSPTDWLPVRVEQSTRDGIGPDGHPCEFVDNIVVFRRL